MEELIDAMGSNAFWMWCNCHMAHLAYVDATGVSVKDSKRTSTNPEAADHVRGPAGAGGEGPGAEAALDGEAEVSLSPILLSRVLQHLDAIKATCGRAGFECSFWKQEEALVEIYSIVQPVANFINLCQASMMSASERTSRVWSSARMVATCPT